jgi:MFS family permease
MAIVDTQQPRQVARPDLAYAYLMTGMALCCIVVSGIFCSIFTPDLVSTSGATVGNVYVYSHQHVPLAAYMGWVFDVIAIGVVLSAAIEGIRAKMTDRAPWTVLGFGVGGIWLAVMFISIFTPAAVSGTAPWLTWNPLAFFLSVVAGLVLTWLLCRMVKKASFEPASSHMAAETSKSATLPEVSEDDAVAKLRRMAQLRDSGVISEDDFKAKKEELLHRI